MTYNSDTANACMVIIATRFVDMINPDNRGNNFSWGTFPQWVAPHSIKIVRVMRTMGIPEDTSELEQILVDFAKTLVDRSGVSDDY